VSTHTTVVPPVDENDEAGAPYAESIVIDEGGIDLKIDGETIIGASFEGIDSYQLAYELLPEHYLLPRELTAGEHQSGLEGLTKAKYISDTDLEYSARLFLTALARRNGYEK
jgi:hypothetical protein